MSDRIDELVALIRPLLYPRGVADNSLAELATIAREAEARTAEWIYRCYQSAEAMCEWLAEALVDNGWCRQDPEGPCRDDGEDCPKCALAAAREAVK